MRPCNVTLTESQAVLQCECAAQWGWEGVSRGEALYPLYCTCPALLWAHGDDYKHISGPHTVCARKDVRGQLTLVGAAPCRTATCR